MMPLTMIVRKPTMVSMMRLMMMTLIPSVPTAPVCFKDMTIFLTSDARTGLRLKSPVFDIVLRVLQCKDGIWWMFLHNSCNFCEVVA